MMGVAAVAGIAYAQDPPKAACPSPSQQAGPVEPEKEKPSQEPAAQIEPAPQVPATPSFPAPSEAAPPAPRPEATSKSTLERYGIAVALGGGVSGFTSETMRDTTQDGGDWGVRVSVGTRSRLGLEAQYLGSAQSIDALGIENDAKLVGNGVQAGLRYNVLDYNIQPFVFGGVAWRHYRLMDEGINTSSVSDRDDVLEIPIGVGLAWKYRGVMFDVRGEFRYAALEDMVPRLDGDAAAMHRYGALADVGFAF
jgi:hypothetical protein